MSQANHAPAAFDTYTTLLSRVRHAAMLNSINSVLGWDERTQLPPKAAGHRADQVALLSRLAHEAFVSDEVGELLGHVEASELARDAESDPAANARELRRDYDRARKLPSSLVEALSKEAVLGQQAWGAARAAKDYSAFEPSLIRMLELKRTEAQCLGSASGDPYDALLDAFEPGETAQNLARMFESLRGPLVELVQQVAASKRSPRSDLLFGEFPVAGQQALVRRIVQQIGFDFEGGRIDVSLHPFCTDLGPGDVRLTTRYREHAFADAFFGGLHEAGHGLYEQGLRHEHFGTPLGQAVSLGIHESQSRLWENFIGRRRSFWRYALPLVRDAFPGALQGVGEDDIYAAINAIEPSLIRVEADEATYNLHILLRFEIERALLRGELSTRDLPGVWNQRMQKYLGITPPDDAAGCLQDIHWSFGAIGYFPTYTLGNLAAAQLFEAAQQDLPSLDASIERGDFTSLLDWLRRNIHQHGRRFTGRDLIQRVTHKPLDSAALLRHLRCKAVEVYAVA